MTLRPQRATKFDAFQKRRICPFCIILIQKCFGPQRERVRQTLDQQTLTMKKALHALLTAARRRAAAEIVAGGRRTSRIAGDARPDQRAAGARHTTRTPGANARPSADPIQTSFRSMTALEWTDWTTRWGVFLVGVCLLLGLFSRSACVVGAGFLLMFYLSMPPLPGLPDNPKAEGTYLFINKNLIEMLALLTLATTASGRWVGLDGLLYCLNPFRWGRSTQPERSGRPGPRASAH